MSCAQSVAVDAHMHARPCAACRPALTQVLLAGGKPPAPRGQSMTTDMHVDPGSMQVAQDLDAPDADIPEGAMRFEVEAQDIADALSAPSPQVCCAHCRMSCCLFAVSSGCWQPSRTCKETKVQKQPLWEGALCALRVEAQDMADVLSPPSPQVRAQVSGLCAQIVNAYDCDRSTASLRSASAERR